MAQIPITELREKIGLLKEHPGLLAFRASDECTSDMSKPSSDEEVCKWMQQCGGTPKALGTSELAVGKKANELTAEHARSFLLAFFDGEAQSAGLDPSAGLGQPWLDLLAEPVDAFRARVRLGGGQCPGLPEGAYWDRFFTPTRQREADEKGRSNVELLRPGQQGRPRKVGLERLFPTGAPNPFPQPDEPRNGVCVGDKIAFRVDLSQALERGGQTCHLRVVQEVETVGKRRFLPLVPYPGPFGDVMPPTHVAAGFVSIPTDVESHAFNVPPGLGPRRRLIIIVTRQPALKGEDDPVDQPASLELPPSFMDLLAARLAAPAVEFSLMRFEYLVWPTPEG